MDQQIYDGLVDYVNHLNEELKDLKNDEGRMMLHKQYMDGFDRLEQIHRDDMEFCDKEERRRIEEERNNMSANLEEKKQHVGKARMALELTKILAPIAGGVATLFFAFSCVNDIEKDGCMKNRASNLIVNQIPKICNWR